MYFPLLQIYFLHLPLLIPLPFNTCKWLCKENRRRLQKDFFVLESDLDKMQTFVGAVAVPKSCKGWAWFILMHYYTFNLRLWLVKAGIPMPNLINMFFGKHASNPDFP